ncbi:hypothetical protein UFOVP1313_70 [uncultured Caudovirales phage]|uniref:Uncharacterized protein n=1 Tax=uncultured Caudovirales phage TaxID=2100421 RepID=A0A6J5RLH3_9CAUD|nr:hypothetical protein UFOVP1313_70 [uncultured Caudovirales phage]
MSSTRFDKAAADRFLVAVRAGAPDEIAAMHAEVQSETIKTWLRGDTEATAKFAGTVKKARADLHLLAISQVRRNVGEDRASALYVAQSMEADLELQRLRELTL